MEEKTRIKLIRANRYIFGKLLNFTFWEMKWFERLVRGKDKAVYQYTPVHKYNWKHNNRGGL